MLENDYIIKQINIIIDFLCRVLFKKDTYVFSNIKDENGNITDAGELYLHIHSLLDKGMINKAEDVLFSAIEKEKKPEYLEIAVDFYGTLNDTADSFLEDNDFSRAEISDGIKDIKRLYNLEVL